MSETYCTIDLEVDDKIYLHLRITGQLLVTPEDYPLEKHTQFIVKLSGHYTGVRKFGRFWYLRDGEDISITGINKLGIEPTSRKLTAEYLKTTVRKSRKPVKEMLHDQSIVAGIGNI